MPRGATASAPTPALAPSRCAGSDARRRVGAAGGDGRRAKNRTDRWRHDVLADRRSVGRAPRGGLPRIRRGRTCLTWLSRASHPSHPSRALQPSQPSRPCGRCAPDAPSATPGSRECRPPRRRRRCRRRARRSRWPTRPAVRRQRPSGGRRGGRPARPQESGREAGSARRCGVGMPTSWRGESDATRRGSAVDPRPGRQLRRAHRTRVAAASVARRRTGHGLRSPVRSKRLARPAQRAHATWVGSQSAAPERPPRRQCPVHASTASPPAGPRRADPLPHLRRVAVPPTLVHGSHVGSGVVQAAGGPGCLARNRRARGGTRARGGLSAFGDGRDGMEVVITALWPG